MFKKIGAILLNVLFLVSVQAAFAALPLEPVPHVADPASSLRVLAIFDKAVSDGLSGDPRVKISQMINWANTAHRNSKTGVVLNLVGVVGLDIGQPKTGGSGPTDELLYELAVNDSVMALRNKYKPAYTIYFTVQNSKNCGLANMPDPWADFWGYGVTFDPLEAISAIGYSCANFVLAHELGHNMGAGHGAKDPNGDGLPFSFSRGYGVDGVFADVMAYSHLYGLGGSANSMIFSTPLLNTCNGLVCGTAASDAARGIKMVAPIQTYYSGCYPATKANGYWGCNQPPASVIATNNYIKAGCEWSELNRTSTSVELGLSCSGSSTTLVIQTRSVYYPDGVNAVKQCKVGLTDQGRQSYELVGTDCSNYKIQAACFSSSTINLGFSCNGDSSCAEAFGRACYSAGGSTVWNSGSYSCQAGVSRQACPATPVDPAPPIFVPFASSSACTVTATISTALFCSAPSCVIPFSDSCRAAGGSVRFDTSGTAICEKRTCPVTPAVCGVNHMSFVGEYGYDVINTEGVSRYINSYCGTCGARGVSTGSSVKIYCQ